ncbi:MAG: ribonuclease Z [Candidatus Aenigmarchaeota archaeon]|nr:ribonuclease Z [Candidatus Aenigmarchaeota archaeon]
MLEIVFLGTVSGIPTKNRNHAAIWLQYAGETGESMLWDCGEGTQRQMLRAKINFMRIRNVFISHWHADHWAGLIGLIQTMNLEKRKEPLHVYAPEAERFVGDILDLGYWGQRFEIIPKDVPFEGHEITSVYKSDDFEMLSTPANHSIPSVAYCFKENDTWNVDIAKAEKLYGLKTGPLVGKLKAHGEVEFKGKKIRLEDVGMLKKGVKVVYSGDTRYTDNIVRLSNEADLLIHDATFMEAEEGKMHSGARDAAVTAKRANVSKLILTHFSRRYLDVRPIEELARKTFPDTASAEDFMRLVLKKQ